ncbi:uncharacterized protein [Drosophila tropicalis]|uniref:uncharacterized protein n=1 Tax=Drosophila tropicalis TaxID=46794 RepID=UPI0035AC24E6
MALVLIHLRRLILLLSVVYLTGGMFRRLLTGHDDGYDDDHLLQSKRVDHSKDNTWLKVPLHFQWWAYIYTCYVYVVLVNYASMRRLTNLVEFFLH